MSFDYGDTPPNVVAQQRRNQERLAAAARGETTAVEPSKEGPTLSMTARDRPAAVASSILPTLSPVPLPLPEPKVRRERVKLEFRDKESSKVGFSLEFDIVDLTITEYSIALAIGSDVCFKPADVMDLNLTVRGKIYPVLYAGGLFDFQTLGVRGIAFLRDDNKRHD